MAHSSREYQRKYMRDYRQRKKKENEDINKILERGERLIKLHKATFKTRIERLKVLLFVSIFQEASFLGQLLGENWNENTYWKKQIDDALKIALEASQGVGKEYKLIVFETVLRKMLDVKFGK